MSNIIDKIQLSGVTYDIGGSGSVSTAITSGDTNAVAGGAVYDKFDEVEQVTAAALNELNDKVNPTVELTQAQYDALVTAGTVQQDTYYIITDATAVDMANYYTTAQTNSLLSGKQNTLVSGTNIKTINNESILGSGNISVEGKGVVGSGSISVSTGTTDYTINFTPSIWTGTGSYSIKENYSNNTASGAGSHAEGYNTKATGRYSHAEGMSTTASTDYTHAEGQSTKASGVCSHAEGGASLASGLFSHAEGYYATASTNYAHAEGDHTLAGGTGSHAEGGWTKATGSYSHAEGYSTTAIGQYGSHAEGRFTTAQNEAEHASGRYNVSSKANTTFGDSGNTLFSVGNGSDSEYRHNVLDIRQNGDIYIVDTSASGDYYEKPMIKLQESLGGTASSAITSGDTNAVAGGAVYDKFDEVEQVTAQALNVLNDKLDEDEEVTAAALNTLNEALSGKADVTAITEAISEAVSGKADSSTVTALASTVTAHTANTTVHVTAQDKTNWNAKSDFSGSYNDLTDKPTIPTVPTSNTAFTNDAGYLVANDISGKTDVSSFTAHTANTTVHVTSSDKSSWNGAATNASNAVTALGGLKLVKLSQSAYDNLQNKDSNTLYVIVN